MVYKPGLKILPTENVPSRVLERLDAVGTVVEGVLAPSTDPDMTGGLFTIENSGKFEPETVKFDSPEEIEVTARVAKVLGHPALAAVLAGKEDEFMRATKNQDPEAIAHASVIAGEMALQAFDVAGHITGIHRVLEAPDQAPVILGQPDPAEAIDPALSDAQMMRQQLNRMFSQHAA